MKKKTHREIRIDNRLDFDEHSKLRDFRAHRLDYSASVRERLITSLSDNLGSVDTRQTSKEPPQKRTKQLGVQGWDYDKQIPKVKEKRDGDILLWCFFCLLLPLVILFSQRSWLLKLFPFDNRELLELSVEVLRLEPPSDKEQQESSTELDKNSLQQFEQPIGELLRIEKQSDNLANMGRFRDIRLFFVRVQDDGQLELKSVLHQVPFDQAPLSRTVEQLLKGPSPQEINKGFHSMLPPNIEILGIRIIGTTAFLNLSQEFYEIVALPAVLIAAVKQLIFTVTEYPNVRALRILVEGQPILAKNLPENSFKVLADKGLNLDSEIDSEDLWQEEMGQDSLE